MTAGLQHRFRDLSLNAKFSVILLIVFLLGTLIAGFTLYQTAAQRAEEEVTVTGNTLLQTMNAVRDYTSLHIRPQLADKLASESEFISQTVPAYSARTVFEIVRENPDYENFLYKEATLNPTNPRNQADEFETTLVNQFRDNPNLTELNGFRTINGEEVFYIARPLSVGSDSCLSCHASPDTAPTSMVNTYGDTGGYGWHLDEIIAAQIIYVPSSDVFKNARVLFLVILAIFVGVFIVAIILLNRLLKPTVVQPIEKMAHLAQVIHNDEKDEEVFRPEYLSGVAARKDELGNLAASLYKMSTELQRREQSLKDLAASLEKRVAERTNELQEVASALQASNHELAKLNIELDDARKKAVEASEIKSNFLASVSHELRTPLNAIIGFSQLSLTGIGGELSEKTERNMNRILTNGRHLLSLINSLLDLAKIESGQAELIIEPFILTDIIKEVEQQTQGLAAEKGLRYEVSIDPKLPKRIEGDRDRIKQILINLISNAIKFTESGAIRLTIGKGENGSWRLSVNDTGIGIPPHALEYIFDEFRQVDQSSTRKFGGTGLGLAIVRNLAALMDGSVKAESVVDQGSTFTVTLPLSPA